MQNFWRTIGYLKKHPWWLSIFIICAVLLAVLALVEPLFFREIVDTLTAENTDTLSLTNSIKRIVFWWVLILVITIGIRVFLTYFADVLIHKLHVDIWSQAIERVLRLSLNFHNSKRAGKVMRELDRGADEIFFIQLDFLRRNLTQLVSILLLVPLMFYLNYKLATLLTLMMPTLGLIGFFGAAKTRKEQSEVDRKWSKASALQLDSISNIAVIMSFNALGQKMREIKSLINRAHREQLGVLKWWTLMIVLAQFSSMIALLGVFAYGAYLNIQGEITVGTIVMFSGFALIAIGQIEQLFWSFQNYLRKQSWLEKFYTLCDEVPQVKDHPKAKTLKKIEGKVEFNNVNFAHDQNIYTLKQVSFKVEPGQTVALVGHTGSGKTTTVNLLSRFFDLNSGQILIDDQDIANVTQSSLRAQIGMVFQDNLLFHASVKENLLIGNFEASDQELIKACKLANCHQFISKMPEGYESIVGERGVKLSGGEKQRLAIARAILKNPPILVLDEATSALDAETEQKIQEALESLIKGRTTFIVAHRLSTIKKADQILVFADGQIVEQGNYQELMKQKGHFQKLVAAQVAGFIE
jgi:ATP-binding cassette subfamily B protein